MTIQKKSLIGSLTAAKKAIIATKRFEQSGFGETTRKDQARGQKLRQACGQELRQACGQELRQASSRQELRQG